MEDTKALEEFLALLDEAGRFVSGDPLAEETKIMAYSVEAKKAAPAKAASPLEDISSCHKCGAYVTRSVYAEPILNENPKILFVTPFPEGPSILDLVSYDYFVKWINSIGLGRKDIALSSIIKCPVGSFDRNVADVCKAHLREEMNALKPRAMVLLGLDAAAYMLRRQGAMDDFRGKKFSVNSIPVFVTYTPHELYLDRNLRRPVWDDLKFISSSLGLGESR